MTGIIMVMNERDTKNKRLFRDKTSENMFNLKLR